MQSRIAAAIVLGVLALTGCQDGLDLSGHALEGFDSVGSRGGDIYTPDGNINVEIERDAIPRQVDLTVGRLDECLPDEVVCYEIQPAGLILERDAIVTLDVSNLVDDEEIDGPMPLWVLLHSDDIWRVAKESHTRADTVTFRMPRLGAIALVAAAEEPAASLFDG